MPLTFMLGVLRGSDFVRTQILGGELILMDLQLEFAFCEENAVLFSWKLHLTFLIITCFIQAYSIIEQLMNEMALTC